MSKKITQRGIDLRPIFRAVVGESYIEENYHSVKVGLDLDVSYNKI